MTRQLIKLDEETRKRVWANIGMALDELWYALDGNPYLVQLVEDLRANISAAHYGTLWVESTEAIKRLDSFGRAETGKPLMLERIHPDPKTDEEQWADAMAETLAARSPQS